jgi:hypothetical protein
LKRRKFIAISGAAVNRITVRSGYLKEVLKKEVVDFIAGGESENLSYFPNTSKESQWRNEQIFEANIIQTNRDAAQSELAEWVRFSNKDAKIIVTDLHRQVWK